MKRLIILAACAAIFTACTPREQAQWRAWYAQDSVAAEAFAEEVKANYTARQNESGNQASSTNSRESTWDRIAACESGGRWDYPPVTNRTGTYSGGLMIWTKAWPAYGGGEFAEQAWLATKAQQIIVAERILADQGWGAWDCS